ncbi:XrtA system polysaccharide deacetylase [Chlamydiota bacterium]
MENKQIIKNIFTIDTEEYFQVEAFKHLIPQQIWSKFGLRIRYGLEQLLYLLDKNNIKATFFVLGWLAEKEPTLIREIAQEGHEIASHGYWHNMIYNQTKEEFRKDVFKAKQVLEEITGKTVIGYRAPTYSVIKKTLWALDLLAEVGYQYDSSIFPILHDRYGIPNATRTIYNHKTTDDKSIIEIPLSTVRCLFINIPIGSGGYLRIFPKWYTIKGFGYLNKKGIPAIVNVHIWELDDEQPPVHVKGLAKFRHYKGIKNVREKLENLCQKFTFVPAREYLKEKGMIT